MNRNNISRRLFLAAPLLFLGAGKSAAELSRSMPRRASMAYRVMTGATPAVPNHAEMRRLFREGGGQNLPGEHAISGHRIDTGDGMALSYRKHISFTERGVEDENAIFEKLTVFLPTPLPGNYGIVDLSTQPEIMVFWSRGAAKFSADKVCAGYAEEGEIEFRRERDELQAKFDFRIRPVGTDQYDGRACKAFRFLHESRFHNSSARWLSPWEGGGSGPVGDEECKPER